MGVDHLMIAVPEAKTSTLAALFLLVALRILDVSKRMFQISVAPTCRASSNMRSVASRRAGSRHRPQPPEGEDLDA